VIEEGENIEGRESISDSPLRLVLAVTVQDEFQAVDFYFR